MRPALLALAALALASCGGDGSADWAGYAAYLNAEVRPEGDTITADELRAQYDDEFSCDDTTNEYFVAQTADNDGNLEQAAAAIYYLCDEDQATETFRSIFGVAGSADVRDWADTFQEYASG